MRFLASIRFATLLLLAAIPALARAEVPEKATFLGEARPAGVPQRIITLAPNLTEIVFALGAGDRVVGVTRYDDYPKAVEALPKVGGFTDPSLEAILALRPDLVLCVPNSGNHKDMMTLSRMKVPVLALPAYSLADVYAAIDALGHLLARRERADALLADMKRRVAAVAARAEKRARPRVLLVYGHKPLVAAGAGSFADELLKLAGATNVLADSKIRYPTVPMEVVLKLAPDVIIDASASGTGAELNRDQVRVHWKRFSVLPAVKHDRVFLFDSALWFRPGPRLIDGLERLEQVLFP